MAMFSDDLFNVFEESSQLKEPKSKKRSREDKESTKEDPKRAKIKSTETTNKSSEDENIKLVPSKLDDGEESMEDSQEEEL